MAAINKRTRTNKDGTEVTFWIAQIYVGRDPVTNRARSVSKSFAKQKDAKAWAANLEAGMTKGVKPATTKLTLAEYLREWLEVHATQVRAVTVYNYRAKLRRWVLEPKNGAPPIGSQQLKKLAVGHFDMLYAYMHKQGIKPRGCQYLHGILRRALNDAVRKGLLPRNPTQGATVPKKTGDAEDEAALEAMDKGQADAFLAAAREDRLSALWHVLLLGALRPCEAFALRWEDVDFKAGTVRVAHTLTRTGLDREKHPLGWKLTAPKTKRSRRTLPLPEVAMKELRAWRTQQKRERLAVGSEWQEHGFAFTTQLGTPLELCNVCRGPYRRVMEAAGLGELGPEPVKPKGQPGPRKKRRFTPAFRIYALRHTGASLLLLAGESLKVVSERLGHASIVLTADVYGHMIGGMAQGPADKLEAMFGTG